MLQSQQLWHFSSDAAFDLWTSHPTTEFATLVAISRTPLPLPASFTAVSLASDGPLHANGGETVPKKDVARIVAHLDSLSFQPLISLLLDKVPIDDIEADVLYLSGESQVGATNEDEKWNSRHSMGEGSHKASKWLLRRFSEYGFNCTQHEYKRGFAPMVECVLLGVDKPEELVVIGGHFDSRGVSRPGLDMAAVACADFFRARSRLATQPRLAQTTTAPARRSCSPSRAKCTATVSPSRAHSSSPPSVARSKASSAASGTPSVCATRRGTSSS